MRIVIVGTGTNVGKTHLGVALVTALSRRNLQVCGLKPVESGVPSGQVGADALALANAGVFHVKQPLPYALPDPFSPHLAARRSGVEISLPPISTWVDSHPADWLVIETAGALLSPLGPSTTNLDLATALRPDLWLLVGTDRLGILHEVTACMVALRALCSPPVLPTIVLQTPPVPDDSTGTNAAEVELLGIAPRAFTMPRDIPTSDAYQLAVTALLDTVR